MRTLPAPPPVVWRSLTEPDAPTARPWLDLRSDEVAPTVITATEPTLVLWSSLWPGRPGDRIRLDLAPTPDGGTALRFTLLAAGDPPDESKTGHLRLRLNQLLFRDLRYSYGQ
ncbi:hypothetical protein ACWIGI_10525 [Nocardia sp. NPDC055321]